MKPIGLRRIVLELSTSVGALVIVLGVLDLAAAYSYRPPWYDDLGVRASRRPVPLAHVNSRGLRGPDYATPKAASTQRVLLLGDSFTYGSGVGDDRAVFASLLQERLNALRPRPGARLEVVNGGIPGSLTSEWVRLLERLKDIYQPDVIVVVFFLRDGTLTTSMGAFFEPIRDDVVSRNRASLLYKYVHLYRWTKDAWDRRAIGIKYTAAINTAYMGDTEQTVEWRRAQQNLLRIQAIGREMNAPVGLVVFPILADLDETYSFSGVHDRVRGFGLSHGFATLDLLPAFLGHRASSLWVSASNQHPNEAGHRIAADALLAYVSGLLQSSKLATHQAPDARPDS